MTAADVRSAWTALLQNHSEGVQLVELTVRVSAGAVCAGADDEGNLHLLVPVAPGVKVVTDQRSKSVTISRRELIVDGRRQPFVDVACFNRELNDVFENFAEDVCSGLKEKPDRAASLPARTLSEWRQLLQSASATTLSTEQLAGLFGELHVLRRVVEVDPAHRVDCWQREFNTIHDFSRGSTAVEVKSTLSADSRSVSINGIDQLESPSGGRLSLAFLRLKVHDDGKTVGDLVRLVRMATSQPGFLDEALAKIGWKNDGDGAPRFKVDEERWFDISPSFPRIVSSMLPGGELPIGVEAVTYTVDLSGQEQMDDNQVSEIVHVVSAG